MKVSQDSKTSTYIRECRYKDETQILATKICRRIERFFSLTSIHKLLSFWWTLITTSRHLTSISKFAIQKKPHNIPHYTVII